LLSFVKISTTALVLYKDYAFPKQVDKACSLICLFYLLFKSGYSSPSYTKYIEEIIPKDLASASSLTSFSHSLLKAVAQHLISFQFNGILQIQLVVNIMFTS